MNEIDDNYQPCTKEFALANPDVSQARFYSRHECAWGNWTIIGALAYDRDPSQYEFRTLKGDNTAFESVQEVAAPVHPKTLRDRVTDRIREVCPSPHEATDKDWVFALIDVLDSSNSAIVLSKDTEIRFVVNSRPIGKDRGIE